MGFDARARVGCQKGGGDLSASKQWCKDAEVSMAVIWTVASYT